jgi:flagellar biogenesis protein FliO
MNATVVNSAEKARGNSRVLAVARRLALLVAFGLVIGWMLGRAEFALAKRPEPAGFGLGVLQGALMPLAMPNLFFGHDVPIYAANNTGRTYKLGYTLGVNGCGLIFFGFFFWRLRRIRSGRAKAVS